MELVMKKDIVVIGAGPAGLSFANSLANTGLNILLVESQSKDALSDPAIDGRDIALTHSSEKLMTAMDTWSRIPADEIFPIKEAMVVDGDSEYAMHFDRARIPEEMLGFIVSNHVIRKALYDKASSLENVEILTDVSVTAVKTDEAAAEVTLSNGETLKAALVISADSRFSETRRKMGISADMHDFGRVCIVCRVTHEHSNQGIAHECFFYGQTLAVLPLSENESSIVITVSSNMADRIMSMNAETFSRHVEGQFNSKLGRMELSTERFPYPLVAVWANKFAGQRYAVIGDAAVGMHPVTAHGFNLGLKSQHTLARLIKDAHKAGTDIGASALLKRYEFAHRKAAKPIYLGTNAIVKLFTNDMPLHRLARKAVLRFGNAFPPVKRIITRQLTETSG